MWVIFHCFEECATCDFFCQVLKNLQMHLLEDEKRLHVHVQDHSKGPRKFSWVRYKPWSLLDFHNFQFLFQGTKSQKKRIKMKISRNLEIFSLGTVIIKLVCGFNVVSKSTCVLNNFIGSLFISIAVVPLVLWCKCTSRVYWKASCTPSLLCVWLHFM